VISKPSQLGGVIAALELAGPVALDVETTGLDHTKDRVRLLSLLPSDGPALLVDCFAVDPRPLFPTLAGKELVGHNLPFDLAFLAAMGFEPGKALDTRPLSQLAHGARHARGFHSLAECVQRELGTTLDKTEQASDWSGRLSRNQLRYAALDVAFLPPLLASLQKRIKDSGQEQAAGIEARCLPAMAWLAHTGVAFDLDAWLALADKAEAHAEALRQQLDAAASTRPGAVAPAFEKWTNLVDVNWESPQQVKDVFTALGIKLESTDDDALAAVDHPLAELLREHRSATKLTGTYGKSWVEFVKAGRIHSHWHQIGADTGRMACSDPNLQNLPRDPAYRRCFIAPPGRVLVKADYSQIELRIAAKIANETRMIDAYTKGEDLHTLTAASILGKAAADVNRDDRQLAKAVNFGLLFGQRWKGLKQYAKSNYGLALTDRQAREYRSRFFQAYPALAAWHRQVERQHDQESRTLAGRRRLFERKNPDTWRLNSPVQGTGADGLKLALALLWENRHACPGACPVLVIHDEIVIEADEGQAEAAAAWLKQTMLDAMTPLLDPVPVEVETKIGRTWGDQ
jgi:DNA polymerase-1